MAAETLKSVSTTNLDASPVKANTRGSGAAAYLYLVDDYLAATATGIAATASTYRMVRIPVNAKVKSVRFATDQALDTNAAPTLAFDFNLVFSDSTTDGTSASLQGLIPTTANTGATTTVAAYSSPNIIFGTYTVTSHTVGEPLTDVLLKGSTTNYPWSKLVNTELWSLFGFTNPYSVAMDPGGFFDLLLYTSTAAATGHAGTIYTSISYVV